jgi:hypothetical protein
LRGKLTEKMLLGVFRRARKTGADPFIRAEFSAGWRRRSANGEVWTQRQVQGRIAPALRVRP